MANAPTHNGEAMVTVLPDYDGEVTVDITGLGHHTRYSGTSTKMWELLTYYVDENTAHNLIEQATGKGIDVP